MKISLGMVRNIFLVAFITATLFTFANFYRGAVVANATNFDDPGQIEQQVTEIKRSSDILTTSMVTSITSLLGFIVSAVMKIRKDKRESLESALTLKQKEIEYQRILLELEELKKRSIK